MSPAQSFERVTALMFAEFALSMMAARHLLFKGSRIGLFFLCFSYSKY